MNCPCIEHMWVFRKDKPSIFMKSIKTSQICLQVTYFLKNRIYHAGTFLEMTKIIIILSHSQPTFTNHLNLYSNFGHFAGNEAEKIRF